MIINNLGSNNHIDISESASITGNFQINIEGDNNSLVIGEGSKLGNGLIEIRNNHSAIRIGDYCSLNGQFRCRANHTNLLIGSKTTTMWVQITLHEKGKINIGEDCMFSGDVRMDVSDMHSILDVETLQRINPPENISFADHVWIGQGVHVLKGVSIGAHAILAAKALITKDVPAHSIVAGIPATVIKTGITWDRQRLPFE